MEYTEELKNEGVYECFVTSAKVKRFKGTSKITISLEVRSDLSDKKELKDTNGFHSGEHFSVEYWQKKTTHSFNILNFQYLCFACGIPEGIEINGVNDLNDLVVGRQVRVINKPVFSTYFKRSINAIAPWDISKTLYPNKKIVDEYRQAQGYSTDFSSWRRKDDSKLSRK